MSSKADEKKVDPVVDQVGLDDETEVELQLKSQDMLTFKVNKDVVMQSALIKTIWSGDQTETEIPLPNVRGSIIKKVIKYMQYQHTNPAKEIEKPFKSANMREVVSEWYANFVEVDKETLFELILDANYMDIKHLLDLTCAKFASIIKGKTTEEIRKRINIQNEFIHEEEESVSAENK
eukprot:551235_1